MALSALRTAWLFTGVRETPQGAIFYHNKCSDFITSTLSVIQGDLTTQGHPGDNLLSEHFIWCCADFPVTSGDTSVCSVLSEWCHNLPARWRAILQCNVQFSCDRVLNHYKTWFTIVRRYPRENKKFPNLNLWVWHIFQIPHFEFLLLKVLRWITFYSFFQSHWRIVRRWNFGPRRLAWV